MQFIGKDSRGNRQLLIKGLLLLMVCIGVTFFVLEKPAIACTYTEPSQTTIRSYASTEKDKYMVYRLLQPTTETHGDSIYGSYYDDRYHDSCDTMEKSTIYSCVYRYFIRDDYCYNSHNYDRHYGDDSDERDDHDD